MKNLFMPMFKDNFLSFTCFTSIELAKKSILLSWSESPKKVSFLANRLDKTESILLDGEYIGRIAEGKLLNHVEHL